MRPMRLVFATLALVALSACDSGPSGPATVAGTVSAPLEVGAVVIDVVWPGVQGFEARGSTQVYSASVAGEPDRYRVVLLTPGGGDLTFSILVDDLYLEGPVVTLVEAAGTNNQPRPVGDLSIRLER